MTVFISKPPGTCRGTMPLNRRAAPILLRHVLSRAWPRHNCMFSMVCNSYPSSDSHFKSCGSSSSSSLLSTLKSNYPRRHYSQSSFPYQYVYESSDFEPEECDPLEIELTHVKSLHETLRKLKEFPTREEAIGVLEDSGATPTERLIFELLIMSKGEWKSAILAYHWGVSNLGHSGLGDKVRHLIVWILGKNKRFDLAWNLIKDLHRYSLVTSQMLLTMIRRYCAADDPSRAIKTFQAMDAFKVNQDQRSFHVLLRALCKHHNIEEAEELVFQSKKFFPPETETFNILLDGWCNIVVDIFEAKRLWREMSNCCVLPDATTYTHMICCFSKHENLFDSLRLYDEMKRKGFIPGISVYNSLIYVMSREKCVQDALNILSKIREANLQPDVATYESLIYPLCEAHKIKDAYSLLDDMIHEGLKPTARTYHAFVKVEHMRGMVEVIKRMMKDGCGPTSETFLCIFEKLSRQQPWNLLEMWNRMKKCNVIPESAHYSIVVHGLLASDRYCEAREIYREMKLRCFCDPKLDLLLRRHESLRRNANDRKREAKTPTLGQKVQNAPGPKNKVHTHKVNSDPSSQKNYTVQS